MGAFDMSLEDLQQYRPTIAPPEDFDEVWANTLAESREIPMQVHRRDTATRLRTVRVEDLRFPGFGGEPIAAWLIRPANCSARLPVIVNFEGYGGGRGLPLEHLFWASAGYAELFMDTRGQGSTWGSGGDTADPHGSDPAYPGFLTRGILSFDTYYYRRLFTDAVRAVDAARSLEFLDPERVVVAGSSQGGGMALATAGLVDDLAGVIAGVPFLCHVQRALAISDAGPYAELEHYLAVHRDHVRPVFDTLAYVDGMHHGSRASAPALFTAGLRDHVCPPSTVFAAYHAYGGPSTMITYEFNGHESGGAYQRAEEIAFVQDVAGVFPSAR